MWACRSAVSQTQQICILSLQKINFGTAWVCPFAGWTFFDAFFCIFWHKNYIEHRPIRIL
jgi:hypothetical protein